MKAKAAEDFVFDVRWCAHYEAYVQANLIVIYPTFIYFWKASRFILIYDMI